MQTTSHATFELLVYNGFSDTFEEFVEDEPLYNLTRLQSGCCCQKIRSDSHEHFLLVVEIELPYTFDEALDYLWDILIVIYFYDHHLDVYLRPLYKPKPSFESFFLKFRHEQWQEPELKCLKVFVENEKESPSVMYMTVKKIKDAHQLFCSLDSCETRRFKRFILNRIHLTYFYDYNIT